MKKHIDTVKNWYFEKRYSFFDFTIIAILSEMLEEILEHFILK